jgi:hypothetical protein
MAEGAGMIPTKAFLITIVVVSVMALVYFAADAAVRHTEPARQLATTQALGNADTFSKMMDVRRHGCAESGSCCTNGCIVCNGVSSSGNPVKFLCTDASCSWSLGSNCQGGDPIR